MQIATLVFLTFLVLQRLGELAIARRNTVRLLARGGHEVGAAHYPVMVAMHTAWVLSLIVLGHDKPVYWSWLAGYAILQLLRIWILATLAERWTTRVIVVPEPLVMRGPFRFLRHPNYTLVVAEIIVAPMVLGLVWVAIVFSVLNAAMLCWRISVENAALAPQRHS